VETIDEEGSQVALPRGVIRCGEIQTYPRKFSCTGACHSWDAASRLADYHSRPLCRIILSMEESTGASMIVGIGTARMVAVSDEKDTVI
jgi:hypothetical protein